MLPINDSKNLYKWGSGDHYSVLFVNTRNKTFTHLDSVVGKHAAHAKEMAISILDENSFDGQGKFNWIFDEFSNFQ